MKIRCLVEETELEGDYGPVPSVRLTCEKCGHETESFGTSENSIRRCLALMNDECECKEDNFYVADGDGR
jgi:hypothetical protein